MTITTPRPWPENCRPTPEQFRDWFLACTAEEQLLLADRMLQDSDRALRCLIAGHDGLLDELRALSRVVYDAGRQVNRYRDAWRSARRRGQALRRIQAYVDDYLTGSAR